MTGEVVGFACVLEREAAGWRSTPVAWPDAGHPTHGWVILDECLRTIVGRDLAPRS